MQVSVIVPSYNVAAYLDRCLDSVLTQQGLQRFEVLVADDGSTDNSVRMARNKAQTAVTPQAKLQVLTCGTNSGTPAVPRNLGLAQAQGEYVCFVDADDWIDPGMLATLYRHAQKKKSDVVSAGCFYRHHEDNVERMSIHYHRVHPWWGGHRKALTSSYFPIVWTRMYRRELLIEHRIVFPEIPLSEDYFFSAIVHALARKTDQVKSGWYHQQHNRVESTTELRTGALGLKVFDFLPGLQKFMGSYVLSQHMRQAIWTRYLGSLLFTYDRLAPDLQQDFKSRFAQHWEFFQPQLKSDLLAIHEKQRLQALLS